MREIVFRMIRKRIKFSKGAEVTRRQTWNLRIRRKKLDLIIFLFFFAINLFGPWNSVP